MTPKFCQLWYCFILRFYHTSDGFVKCAFHGHIFHCRDLESSLAKFLLPESAEILDFRNLSSCSPYTITRFHELICNMRANVTIDSCHEYNGVFWNCRAHIEECARAKLVQRDFNGSKREWKFLLRSVNEDGIQGMMSTCNHLTLGLFRKVSTWRVLDPEASGLWLPSTSHLHFIPPNNGACVFRASDKSGVRRGGTRSLPLGTHSDQPLSKWEVLNYRMTNARTRTVGFADAIF